MNLGSRILGQSPTAVADSLPRHVALRTSAHDLSRRSPATAEVTRSCCLEHLHQRDQPGGTPLRRFTPHKGHILVWHSLLSLGGSLRTTTACRMSLVGHHRPTGMTPHDFGFLPQGRQQYLPSRNGRGWFCPSNSPYTL